MGGGRQDGHHCIDLIPLGSLRHGQRSRAWFSDHLVSAFVIAPKNIPISSRIDKVLQNHTFTVV